MKFSSGLGDRDVGEMIIDKIIIEGELQNESIQSK